MENDLINRQAAIDEVDSETVSTNPEHFKSSEKFIKFMDDADIASFGKWQWANGFNTALAATTIQLKKLPSTDVQPVVHCKYCRLRADVKDVDTGEMYHTCGALGFIIPDGFACNQGKRKGSDCTDCIKNGGDLECDHIHCHKGVGC